MEPCGQERRNGRDEIPPASSGDLCRKDHLIAGPGESDGSSRRQARRSVRWGLRRCRTNRDTGTDGSEEPDEEKNEMNQAFHETCGSG